MLLDTAGPALTRLMVAPDPPIRNSQDAPQTLAVEFGLSDLMKEGEIPELSYTPRSRLSRPNIWRPVFSMTGRHAQNLVMS